MLRKGDSTKTKPDCKFGSSCYRRNSEHLKSYSHGSPKSDDLSGDEPIASLQRKPSETKAKLQNVSSENCSANKKAKIEDFFQIKPKSSKSISKLTELPEKLDIKSSDEDSENADDTPQPDSPIDVKENIKAKFLIDMPEDFYDFFNFCKSIDKVHPRDIFQDCLGGLQLVGPFIVLSGDHHQQQHKSQAAHHWLTCWRYFHDPPEMTTVVSDGNLDSQFHLGYFCDDPKESFTFVVSAETSKSGELTPMGDNLFAAFNLVIEAKKKCSPKLDQLNRLQKKLVDFAKSKDYTLTTPSPAMLKRKKKVVCPTLHGAGLMVPVDANDIGYRPVPSSHGDLKKMLERIVGAADEDERNRRLEPLDELITYIQFANDEGDFGEGLELGLDLLAFHPKGPLSTANILNEQISSLLSLGYQLAGRPQYETIIREHMSHRKKTLRGSKRSS